MDDVRIEMRNTNLSWIFGYQIKRPGLGWATDRRRTPFPPWRCFDIDTDIATDTDPDF